MDSLVLDTPRSMGELIGGIFRGGIFLCVISLLRFILCLGIGELHALPRIGSFV